MRQMWGGRGTGETCVACAERIAPEALVIECRTQTQALHLHVECFYLWQEEREA
jgi:hypothetical protein